MLFGTICYNTRNEIFKRIKHLNFKSIATITAIGMVLSFISMLYLNMYIEAMPQEITQKGLLLADVKNILIGIFVGLAFSFLFSIQTIREFILKSVSNYMADDGYLQKLGKKELERLKDKVFSVMHGVDLVSNEQSLFHYIKKLDQFLSTPHKSIVNEYWSISYFGDNKDFFRTKRVQEYRVHTLDLQKHNKFDVIYKYSLNVHNEENLQKLKDNFTLVIEANNEKFTVENLNDTSNNNMVITNSYDNNVYEVYIKKEIELKAEFTKVHIETIRLEEIDDSIAVVSNHATYGMNYAIVLPEDIVINNVFHHDTLYSEKEKQVSVINDGNKVAINVNGWHLPGLIFVLTYAKKA